VGRSGRLKGVKRTLRRAGRLGLAMVALVGAAHGAERVTLKSGFSFDCLRRVVDGETIRLYFAGKDDGNYLDVPTAAVVSVEAIADPPAVLQETAKAVEIKELTVPQLLDRAGAAHHIDVDLLASVVHAESAGRVKAVSRTGAKGLMQLMPGTAAELGVKDAFVPGENVEGGTKYLDQLLTRYHDDVALALAAYNAGPGAVDRYHGVPPFRETRAYVSRIIREFNQRKATLLAAK
jgi:soluble lytic murein transglycosylase-like protein